MITLASIVLYAVSVFIGTMIGFAASEARGNPVDAKTEYNLTILGSAFLLFFALAVLLQVAA